MFSYFCIPSLFTRIVPLLFQTGGRRRQPNLSLVFYVDFVLYVFLVKAACLFFVVFDLVLSYGAIVVFPCVGTSIII